MQLINTFAIIVIGIIISRFLEDPESYIKVLNNMTFNLFLPVLILMLLWKGNVSRLSMNFAIAVLLPFFIAFTIVLLILKVIKKDRKAVAMYPLASVFGNLAYLGLPIISSILGRSGLELAIFVVLVHTLTFFTFGIIWVSIFTYGSITTKRVLQISMRNPLVISSLIGVILSSLHIPLSSILEQILNMLGNVALPSSLLLVGMWVGNEMFSKGLTLDIKNLSDTLFIVFFKMFFLPFIFYLLIFLGHLNLSMLEIKVIIIQLSMPLAIVNFIIAKEYDCHADTIARAVIISTLLLPITVHVLNSYIH